MSDVTISSLAARDVRGLLAASQNLAAFDRARAAINEGKSDHEIEYLFALACVRSGASMPAQRMITRLREQSGLAAELAADVESLSGRLGKDAFVTARDAPSRAAALDAAICAYRKADVLHPNIHARINAASLLYIAGDIIAARQLAQTIFSGLNNLDPDASHWDCATAGEAALLSGDIGSATGHYRRARDLAGTRYGDIASMRRQLSMLAEVLPEAGHALEQIQGPHVIAFSGHMIDAPGREIARFPPALEGAVRDAIDHAVAASVPAIGYTQAACGSDILFCESMLARSQEINIVLPFARDDYVLQSVALGGELWINRFDRVLERANSLTFATEERYLGDDTLFEHASNLIQGMAFLRAGELAVNPQMLVVADSSHPGGVGGTLATQSAWADQDRSLGVIELAEIRDRYPSSIVPASRDTEKGKGASPPPVAAGGRTIKSLLFADVKGFSRLPEEYFPTFFTTFLGLVPETLRAFGIEPLEISSRGDGLYAVFAETEQAARFALGLSRAVGAIPWGSMGLPDDTHVRIALHAGPVFTATDPVTGKLAHYGTHVTRAARVEPVVVPGQVLVTEPFAAVLASRRGSAFACDLVGTEPLAKGYGTARLYRLREK